ncbi:hypothetical protein AHAS_Ahas20G0102700 [Arachis hypogaea]
MKDVAMLWLIKETEHKVETINYKNYTIKLVNSIIEEDDCSSLPHYLLYKFNFSDANDNHGVASKQQDVNNAYHATQMLDYPGVDSKPPI